MESEFLSCPICYEEYNLSTNLPRIIPLCGHTLCSQCLMAIIRRNRLGAKCPLDKKNFFQRDIQSFPVNFLANQLLENRQSKNLCKNHREEITFACFTDKTKICNNCVCEEKHKGHKIKPLKKIKQKIAGKEKEIEEMLSDMDTNYQTVYDSLEIEKATLQETIQEKFNELRELIYEKEQELLFEVKILFELEKNRAQLLIKDNLTLRDDLSRKLSDLTDCYKNLDFLNEEGFFSSVKNYIQECKSRTREDLVEKEVSRIEQVMKKISKRFVNQMEDQKTYWKKFEFPFMSNLENSVLDFSKELNIEEDFDLTEYVGLFKVKSRFTFEFLEDYLKILNNNQATVETEISLQKLNEIEEIKLELDQPILESDRPIFSYVWRRAKNPKFLKVKLNPGCNYEDVWDILIRGPNSFSALWIDLEDYEILPHDPSTVISFIEALVSRMNNIKKLMLFINKITLNNTYTGFKTGFPKMDNLEHFELFLEETDADDENILQVFTPFPKLKQFLLRLNDTKITDSTIKALTNKTICSTDSLVQLGIHLKRTEVTDEGMRLLFSQLKRLKKFYFDISFTKITDKTLEALAQAIENFDDFLEEFQLNVGNTDITDEGLIKIFQKLPKIRSFFLGLDTTGITDKSIQAFAERTLVSIECLETFEMWLSCTKVTDACIDQLFLNLQNVKKLSLDLHSTGVSDKSIRPFIDNKIQDLGGLKELKLEVTDTHVSPYVQTLIEEVEFNLRKGEENVY